MITKKIFELKKSHLKLIRNMWVTYSEKEFGAPAIDPKRPYGNKDVISDIAQILEIEPLYDGDEEFYFSDDQENFMISIHEETAIALQIILNTGLFEPGIYESEKPCNYWKKVN